MKTDTQTLTRRYVFLLVMALTVFLFACQLTSPRKSAISNANELYEQLLNLPVPSEISQLAVSADSAEAGLWTEAYFTYNAPSSYLKLLSRHTAFAEASEFNMPISPVSCTGSQMPGDFNYWTDRKISLDDKECYVGVYFPYIHYLVYSPETEEVHHFVAGMSG